MVSVGHNNESLKGGTFTMAGKSYHRIGSIVPADGVAPAFAQIYLLDPEDATNRRLQLHRNMLDYNHLKLLHELLLL